MEHSFANISELFKKTALSLPKGDWLSFLRTVAWNFKYDFRSQVLIFAQKPTATACAPGLLWNERFHRTANQDAAIALLAEQGALRYVFDLADTTAPEGTETIDVPVWTVSPEQLPAIRRGLTEAFVPLSEQTSDLVSAPLPVFFRIIANNIVQQQCHKAINNLLVAQDSCSLKKFDSKNVTVDLRRILAESLATILQYRCGCKVDVFEPCLESLKYFDSLQAISVLGVALQKIAYLALQNVAHSVKLEKNGWMSDQTSNPCLEGVEPPENEHVESTLCISQEDIDRALIEGPPLPGGKFRLYQVAADPETTIDTLSEVLRKEYGTGKRPILSSCGLPGILSWDAEGLKFALNGLSEGNHLTQSWKTASGRLKTLISANLYLSKSDKANMSVWFSNQQALETRQKVGAALTAFFAGYEPDRQSLRQSDEWIRAYVYESSPQARQKLNDKLCSLIALEHISKNSDAQALFHTIMDDLNYDVDCAYEYHHGVSIPEAPNLDDTTNSSYSEFHPAGEVTWVHPADTSFNQQSSNKMSPTQQKQTVKQNIKSPEPLIDHPELCRTDQSRSSSRDKVALTDLLLHFSTYRATFCRYTPALSERDAACREEDFEQMDGILVSSCAEENLKNIRTAKRIISRWFLPFDGIRPDVLTRQDQLLTAADSALQTQPTQDFEPAHVHRHTHKHDYAHRHTESIAAQGVSETCEETLFDYISDETPNSITISDGRSSQYKAQENQASPSCSMSTDTPPHPQSLAEQIELAQLRSSIQATKAEKNDVLCRA